MSEKTSPLRLHQTVARFDWMDYNGHMNDGYYAVAFTSATDAVQDYVGLDAAYREESNCSIYTVEAHLTYQREVKMDTHLHFESYVLGVDQKRLHLLHAMYNTDEDCLAATHELMLLHVDQQLGKTTAMPDTIRQRLIDLQQLHASLTLPVKPGKRITKVDTI